MEIAFTRLIDPVRLTRIKMSFCCSAEVLKGLVNQEDGSSGMKLSREKENIIVDHDFRESFLKNASTSTENNRGKSVFDTLV